MEIPQLQPLSFGELLDRVFTYYRRNFGMFFGIMVVPHAILFAGNTVLQVIQAKSAMITGRAQMPSVFRSFSPTYFLVFGMVMIIYYGFFSVAMGATAFGVSEIHMGRTLSARGAYRKVIPHLGRIFSLMVNISLRMLLAFFVIGAGMGIMIVGVTAAGASLGKVVAVFVGLAAFAVVIAGAVLVAGIFLRYSFAICALLLENIKSGPAIKRSVLLSKDNVTRIFLIGLLMTIISWTVGGMLQGPFVVATIVLNAKTHAMPPFWLGTATALAGGIGYAATGGLAIVGIVLLYYDARVRKEGFDLQLMMSALDAGLPEGAGEQNGLRPQDAPITPMNLGVMIALSFLTMGVYIPLWFIQKRSGINQLNSSRKVGLFLPILALVLIALLALLNFGVGDQIPAIHNLEIMWDPLANLIAAGVVGFLMVIQAYQVRNILEEHSLAHSPGPLAGSLALVHRSTFSMIGTFFFGIFYLQHKINEMVETWPQTQPALGPDPVPAA